LRPFLGVLGHFGGIFGNFRAKKWFRVSHFGSQEKSASLSVTGYSACGARYFFFFLRPFAPFPSLALKFFALALGWAAGAARRGYPPGLQRSDRLL